MQVVVLQYTYSNLYSCATVVCKWRRSQLLVLIQVLKIGKRSMSVRFSVVQYLIHPFLGHVSYHTAAWQLPSWRSSTSLYVITTQCSDKPILSGEREDTNRDRKMSSDVIILHRGVVSCIFFTHHLTTVAPPSIQKRSSAKDSFDAINAEP